MPPTLEHPPAAPLLDDRGAPATASGAWLADISPAKRSVLRSLHELSPSWNWVIVLFPALWFLSAAAVVAYPVWFVRWPVYVVIGASLHAMSILVHEASHSSLFRNHFLDRWVGFLLGVPVLVSHSAYKTLHGFHHRYTRDEEDPDEFHNVTTNKIALSIFFYAWIVIGTPVYLIHVPLVALRRGSARERRNVIVEYLLLVAIWAAALAMAAWRGRLDLIVHAWALPMLVVMVFANFRSWAEHAMTLPGDPLTRTRTVTSNRLVSFLMCNLNYHLEHHLCPGIPWYNLPKMHDLLQEEYRRAGAFVYSSYLRFLWDALRTGVHGVARTAAAPRPDGNPARRRWLV